MSHQECLSIEDEEVTGSFWIPQQEKEEKTSQESSAEEEDEDQ